MVHVSDLELETISKPFYLLQKSLIKKPETMRIFEACTQVLNILTKAAGNGNTVLGGSISGNTVDNVKELLGRIQ